MKKRQFDLRALKKVILKSLLRGGITAKEVETLQTMFKKPIQISNREATADEWQQLEKRLAEGNGVYNTEPENDTKPPSVYFDRAIFKRALKGKFDSVKGWFEETFGGGQSIEIIIFDTAARAAGF